MNAYIFTQLHFVACIEAIKIM